MIEVAQVGMEAQAQIEAVNNRAEGPDEASLGMKPCGEPRMQRISLGREVGLQTQEKTGRNKWSVSGTLHSLVWEVHQSVFDERSRTTSTNRK